MASGVFLRARCATALIVAFVGVLAAPAARADQFGPPSGPQYTFGSSETPGVMASGDFNNDGVTDLAVATYTGSESGEVQILLGSVTTTHPTHGLPTSTFTGFTPAPGSPIDVGTVPYGIVAGNFGNGQTDLAIESSNGAGVSIYLGNGQGGFTEAAGSPIYVDGALAVGQFTAGKPDEIAVVSGNNTAIVGATNAAGTAYGILHTDDVTLPGAEFIGAATAGKFSSSGDVGLAALDTSNGTVSILLGNGAGAFTLSPASPIRSGLSEGAGEITTGDFTTGSHADLAIGSNTGRVSVLLGTGNANGAFTVAPGSPFQAAPTGELINQIVAAPFGSSAVDGIATADFYQPSCVEPCTAPSDAVSVLLPNGTGGFTQAAGSPYDDDGTTTSIVTGDFNEPGDLAFTDYGDCAGNAVGVLLNYGATGTSGAGPGLYPADRCGIPTPTVTNQPATGVTLTTATMNGTVDPNRQHITSCTFQYGVEESFNQSVPCTFSGQPGNTSVSAQLTGLKGLTNYEYQVVASDAGGTVTATPPGKFQTCPSDQLSFGSAVATGCFKPASSGANNQLWIATGDVDINGLGFNPSSGGGLTIDPNTQELTTTGNGSIEIGGLVSVPWFHGLKLNFSGTFSLSKSVNVTFGGFRIQGSLGASLLPDAEAELTAMASMNIVGDPVQATIVIDTSAADGIAGADVGVGPADASPLDPTTLLYCNPKNKEQPEGFKCVQVMSSDGKSSTWRLTPQGDHPTDVDQHLLPRCSPGTPAPVGWECVQTTTAAGNPGPYKLKALHPGVVKIGGFLPVEGLDFSYDRDMGTWSGSATIALGDVLPGSGVLGSAAGDATLELNATISTNPFEFDSGGFALDGTSIPLGPATLTSADFNLQLHPSFAISGDAGFTAGADGAVSISGGFSFAFGDKSGFDLMLKGDVMIKTIDVGGYVDYNDEDGGIKVLLGGHFTRSWGPVSATLGIGGGLEFKPKFHFQLTGDGTISAFGASINAHGIVSDAGVGACGEIDVLFFSGDVGFTHFWKGTTYFEGCDFSGLYTVGQPESAGDRTRGAQASAGQTVRIPAGTAREEFAAVGASAPPAVTLTGPRGVTLSTPATINKFAISRSGLALAETGANTTYFIVNLPATGTWHLAPDAGQPAPLRYEAAAPLKPIDLKAKVTGTGARRRLSWRLNTQRGQSVQFFQTGGTGELIASSTGDHGRARFTVAPGPGGRRLVIAVLSINGSPRQQLTVARFPATTPHGPVVSHAQYRVKGSSIKVKWHRGGGVADYVLEVKLRGTVLQYMYPASSSSATLTVAPGAKVQSLSITATGKNGITGKVLDAKAQRGRSRKHKH